MQTASRDYAFLTKAGFLLGVALIVVGGGSELVGHALYGSLPAWENTLFTDMEILGIFVGLLSPLVFGIVLPLVE